MKYLITGLGNPGAEYFHTRHNIGFDILDRIAEKKEASFKTERLADVCTTRLKNKELILIKPNTYMNLSGKAVNYWLNAMKIPIERLLVVVDEVNLPLAQIRLRGKGSDGGHNGLASINQVLSSQNYARLRFGVGNDFPRGRQVEYVLGHWTEEQEKLLPEALDRACEAVFSFVSTGLEKTMTQFNRIK